MNKAQTDIFHLVTARIVLRKTLAFCGLLSILLTASCGPTPSGSREVLPPKLSEETETESGHGREVIPEEMPESKPVAEAKPQTPETEPAIKADPTSDANSQTSSEPSSETTPVSNNEPTAPTLSTHQAGGVRGSDISSATSSEEVQKTVKNVNGNYLWAIAPTFVDTYKDLTGQVHEHFAVSPGDSAELKDLLAKMRNDLVARGNAANSLKLEVKEQGPCDTQEGKEAASTKSCDVTAPICLSLEYVKLKNPNANLEQSLRPLIMREFAVQNCADEALAKQVENYYELPAVKNFQAVSKVASSFNRVRVSLLYIKSALTTGVTPNAGKYAQKIDTKEEICSMITEGTSKAQVLQGQVIPSGFIKDPMAPEKAPRIVLTETLNGMGKFCEGSTLDRTGLYQALGKAIQFYDYLAQEFSKNSGMIIMDFSRHQFPHGSTDGTEK